MPRALCMVIALGLAACQQPAPPAADRATEVAIARSIEQRLAGDPAVGAELVDVDVRGGVAVLSGAVGSLEERHRAWWLAKVPGVASVDGTELEVWTELGPPDGARPQAPPLVSER